MGLLSQGKPLDWDETKKYAKYVQERGIAQFINIYNDAKDRADGPFKWGDEVEYIIVKFDSRNKVARVSLKAEEIFHKIEELRKNNPGPIKSLWNPEFASYMVEGTPGLPYGSDGFLLSGLCQVEDNMRYRRQEVQSTLEPGETVMSITSFPRLGCPDFTHPRYLPRPETSASGSLFFPDEAIFGGHPRFKTLVRNIRARRKRKVIINLPVFKDVNTHLPFYEHFNFDDEARKAAKPNHVYMDAMGFGMGCCCLQITLQATHLAEAKVLYDQLAPITPIALALSAASPVYRGILTDRDCRWDVISCAVDDRTREESGETKVLTESSHRIPKSRYDSISAYLTKRGQQYNDLPLLFDRKYYNIMVANKVDPEVARHIAHLFIRDPITLYKEKLEQSDEELDHFENIQSTNWQTMRFKPPPSVDSPIGWRVEFRPCEAQTSDFENAAYVVFITLLSRVILAYKLNFLIPLSSVDENMVEAQKRDSIKESKFWFRKDIMHKSSSKEPLSTVLENCCNNNHHDLLSSSNNCTNGVARGPTARAFANSDNLLLGNSNPATRTTDYYDKDINNINEIQNCANKMTIDEIINGSDNFVGIMPIISHYVESFNDGSNFEMISKIFRYLRLISDRASLKVKTTASLMRDFIDSHPSYNHDSIVNDEVQYDLLAFMDKIGREEASCPQLLGEISCSNNGIGCSTTMISRDSNHNSIINSSNGGSCSGSSNSNININNNGRSRYCCTKRINTSSNSNLNTSRQRSNSSR